MAYGTVKVNTLTYDVGAGDVSVVINTIPTSVDLGLKADKASPTFTGDVTISSEGDLRLGDSGSNYVAFEAPTTVSSSYTLELPADVGATGKVLKSTVAGQVATMTWETDSATDSTKVLKTGDTMTGDLNLAAQSEVRFQDAAGGEYVGLKAPTTATSYTVELPAAAGSNTQILQVNASSELNWVNIPVGDAQLGAAQLWTKAQRGEVQTITTSGGSTDVDMDFSDANNWEVTVGVVGTVNKPTNLVVGQSGSLFIKQGDATGYQLSWAAEWKFKGKPGAPPTLTTGAATDIDRVDYIVQDATNGSEKIQCIHTANY